MSDNNYINYINAVKDAGRTSQDNTPISSPKSTTPYRKGMFLYDEQDDEQDDDIEDNNEQDQEENNEQEQEYNQ